MLGSIYIGLSGMDAYSKGLQTISNNVANLNSNGFKQTTLAFADLFSGGGGRAGFMGGGFGNSGSGVHIGSSLIDFGQGELRQTGNDLDLGIQGSGFLVVLDKDGKTFYTRTGSFAVDKDGYIADQINGDRLAVLDASGQPVAVNINAKQTSAPAATTKITFADNLSSSGTTATVSNISVYDGRGGKQVWSANFKKSDLDPDTWAVTIKDANGVQVGDTATLKFIGADVDPATATSTIHVTPTGAAAFDVTLDFSTGVKSFSGGLDSTIRAASVDGNAVGALSTVTIDENGQVKLTYTNEKTELEGAVAIADFRTPQKLERAGNGLFTNGGEAPRYLASATGGVGKLTPKTIEASNVDLSAEFGDLILIQRGFQACSQVVSVSNDMIQQLFAIRSQ